MKDTYIYIIRELGNGYIKIGIANNPEARLSNLQVGNARELKLVEKIGKMSRMSALEIEKRIHSRLGKFHVRGEWFARNCLHDLNKLLRCGFPNGKVATFKEANVLHRTITHMNKTQAANKFIKEDQRFQRRLAMQALGKQ